jgi:hypothetical protein
MQIDRRIKSIIRKYPYTPINKPTIGQKREMFISEIINTKSKVKFNYFYTCKNNSTEFKERMIVFNYFFRLKKSEEEISNIWYSIRNEEYPLKGAYNNMPKKERRDNAHPDLYGINYGSGVGGYSSIRVPSMKRLNKWKRFKKLFPDYIVK